MHEHENNVSDNIADPTHARRDPPGTYRDTQGRLRVPLDRPDPDLSSAPDHADCDGQAQHEGGTRSLPEDGPGLTADNFPDDELRSLFRFDGGEDVRAELNRLLSPAQIAALEGVVGVVHAVTDAPFDVEVVGSAVRVGAAAVGVDAGDAQARALHRVRRLVFAHRLVERLLERATLRVIANGWVPEGLELAASSFNGAYDPDEGTAGAKVVLGAVHASFPFIAEFADRAARALTRAADLAPAPTPEVGERLQPLSGLAQPIAFHWMALGDDDLGLLDVVLDHLAAVDSADSPMAEVSAETTQGVAPRILSRLPAAVRLFGADPSRAAAFLGQVATELLLRLAVARAAKARVGDGPDASTDRA